ncbi:uncharacterized protein LOC106668481 [Cimex lectularius]|uniref:Uncharacterized protein n=1 Tax=Cimex lectularius TaxID=79782 RepID=A0A8I6RW70_CIMLE|nr:uncharacterized protein LOC106668481 [Cimex lectularius]
MSRKSMSRKSVSRKSVSRKSVSRKSVSRKSVAGGKKGEKSGGKKRGVTPQQEDTEPWKKEVADLGVSDDIWKCHLSILQEKDTALSGIVDLAGQKAPVGNRWPVRVISMDYIREKVLNHCAKTKEETAYRALCDAIKEAAGRNFDQDIPVELLAYFIKYEILEFREIDIDRKIEKERMERDLTEAYLKLDLAAGRRARDEKPKKGIASQGSVKGGPGRRASAKGGPGRRASAKRGSTKRQSTKRQSTKRQSTKRQSTKRQSTKRQSTRRQSKKGGGRKSVAGGGGRKSVAGGGGGRRKSAAGGRGSQQSIGGHPGLKRTKSHSLLNNWKKKRSNLKFDTRLNTREMPRKDIRYVEDFPVGGPQAYFIITQLRHPSLPKTLRSIDIPVDSVIMYGDPRITRDDENVPPKNIEEYKELLDMLERDYMFKKSDKRQFFDFLKEKYSEQGKLQKFWKDFMEQALSQENRKIFENTIITKYSPDLKTVPLKSETRKEEMKNIFYEEMCMLMYFMGRISELYERYNASVKLFNVEAKKVTTPEDMTVYTGLLNSLPNELCDVPIVLDTLIQQVCINEGVDTMVDTTKYGCSLGTKEKPVWENFLEAQIQDLELKYDLKIEDERKKKKIIEYPRTILAGDVIKWKTLCKGNLGRYVRDRTYLMQKIFLSRAAWGKLDIDHTASSAHTIHMQRLRNALGIRHKKEVAEWLVTLGHLCAMDNPQMWKNDNFVFFQEGPVYTMVQDHELTSMKTLIGSLSCSISCCTCMEKVCDEKVQPKLLSELDYLNNIKDLPDYVMYQTLYQLYSEKDVVKMEFNQLLKSIIFQFYNCFSTFNVHCRIETPVNLKNFYQHILTEKKHWCLKELSDIADMDPPRFFKPRMDLLIANLDSITSPVEVSEQLSLTFKDFVDPHSMREDELRRDEEEKVKRDKQLEKERILAEKEEKKLHGKKGEKKPEETKLPQDPIAAAISQVQKPIIGYVYGLSEEQLSVFHERRKNFVLRGGSRLNLKFDESIFGRPLLMLKLLQNGHDLIFHTPLYQNDILTNFTFHHENGMIMSFSERVPINDEQMPMIRQKSFAVKKNASKTSQTQRLSKMSKTSVSKKKKKGSFNTLLLSLKVTEKEDPDKIKFSRLEKQRLFKMFEEKIQNFKDKVFFKKMKYKSLDRKYEYCDCIMTLLKSRLYHLPRPFSYHKAGCVFRKENLEKSPASKFVSEPFNDPELLDGGNKDQLAELDLQISWPTGLHISVLRQPRIGGIYVKQVYLTERKDLPLISDEKFRYILFNGTVLKFMKSDEIQIYYPWGAIVYVQEASLKDGEVIETDDMTEIVLPREVIFPLYNTLTSDSRKVENYFGYLSKSPVEYMEEIDDLFCNTRSLERSDGTKFLYHEDGTSVVRFPDGTEIRNSCGFKAYEYFVEYTPEEMEAWFFLELEEEELAEEQEVMLTPSEIAEEEELPRKILYSKDGFVIVEIWSYSVFHPYFAGVSSGCMEKNLLDLYLPGDTTVHISDKSLYKILIGKKKDFRFKVGASKLILDSLKNGRLYQRSVLNYFLLRNKIDPNSPKTLFSTRTDDFTDLKINNKGEIQFRILPERDDSYNLSKATVDKRQFILKQDNSGVEILSTTHVKNLMEQVEKIPGSKVDRFRPAKLTHTVMFNPIDTVAEYWLMRYPPVKTRNRYVIPSTYGKSYLYPIRLEKNTVNESNMLLMNLFKTIEFVDKENTFLDVVAKYKELVLLNEDGPSCDCSVQVIADNVVGREDSTLCRYLAQRKYRHSTTTGKAFNRFVRKKLVPQIMRMATKKFNVTRNLKTMRFHLHHLYERSSPVYFESAKGAIFLILEQIVHSAEDIIFDIHRCEKMEELIEKPMEELTDDMILDLSKCIKPLEMGLGEITRQEVFNVLMSARELKEYFSTMHEALDYRRYAITTERDDFGELNCKKLEEIKKVPQRKYRLPTLPRPSEIGGSKIKIPHEWPSLLIVDKNVGNSLFQFFAQFLKRDRSHSRSRSPDGGSTTSPALALAKGPDQMSIPGFGDAKRCEWVNTQLLKKIDKQELEGYVHSFCGKALVKSPALHHLLLKTKKKKIADTKNDTMGLF